MQDSFKISWTLAQNFLSSGGSIIDSRILLKFVSLFYMCINREKNDDAIESWSLLNTSQPGPDAAQKKLNEMKTPIWTFFVKQSFFSIDLFRFGGRFGRGHF